MTAELPDAMPDAPDTTAPAILTSSPADMDRGVTPLEPIVIRFDEPLDPASVTAASVQVRYVGRLGFFEIAGMSRFETSAGSVRGTATYDEEFNKLVFVPRQPLPYGARVFVTIAGIKDVAGNEHAGASLTFDMVRNAEARHVFLNNGVIGAYRDFGVTAEGSQTEFSTRNAGADGQWFTSDDRLTERYPTTLDANGLVRFADQMNAGPDAILGTVDDVPAGTRYRMTHDADLHLTDYAFVGAGPDGTLGTPDDVQSSNIHMRWVDGLYRGLAGLSSPGTDMTWGTSDDRMTAASNTFTRYEYNAAGFRIRERIFTVGSDLIPDTVDDGPGPTSGVNYGDYTLDADGFVTQIVRRGLGADLQPFTSDDPYQGCSTTSLNAQGLPIDVRNVPASGVGADLLCPSADDTISSRTVYAYTPEGLLLSESPMGPGADGVPGTNDDVPTSVTAYAYDGRGVRITSKLLSNPGLDAMWGTADDRVEQVIEYGAN